MVGKKLAHNIKENEAELLPYTICIVESRWKTKMWEAIKLIEEGIGEYSYLCVLWLEKFFLNDPNMENQNHKAKKKKKDSDKYNQIITGPR